MLLIDLPVEMIQELCYHILPADLENFAFSCKHIATIAAPSLSKHRILIEKYSEVGGGALVAVSSIPALITEFVNDPCLGHYAGILNVCTSRQYPETDEQDYSVIHNALGECEHLVSPPAKTSSMSWWRDDDRIAEQRLLLPYLLTPVPNLSTLKIIDIKTEDEVTKPDLVNLFCNVSQVKDSPVLGKLRNVKLVSWDDDNCYELDTLIAISAIPSLRNLSVTWSLDLVDLADELDSPPTSRVTALVLVYSRLSPLSMERLLPRFVHLKEFSHYYNSLVLGDSPAFEPSSLIKVLLNVASNTLNKLTLIACWSATIDQTATICDFTALTEAYVDWLIFPTKERCTLSAILPPSIRSVAIQGRNRCLSEDEAEQCLLSAIRCKTNTTLPNLEKLSILSIASRPFNAKRTMSIYEKDHVHQCMRAGIQLDLSLSVED